MRGTSIEIGKIELLTIYKLNLCKELNSHGRLVVNGLIDEENYDEAEQLLVSDDFIQLTQSGQKKEKEVLFTGVITQGSIRGEGKAYIIEVVLEGSTKLLDVKRKTRSYQNSNQKYLDILKSTEQAYSNCKHCAGVDITKQTGDIIVQYKETDWEFLMRLASHFNTSIYPCFNMKGILYYFGVPNSGAAKEIESPRYEYQNLLDKYRFKKDNGVTNLMQSDEMVYIVESKEIFELGEKVIFKDEEKLIYKIDAFYKEAELVFKYYLKEKAGFQTVKQYNYKLIGASLDGKIMDIKSDKVKVHLAVDESQNISDAKWFNYSTVYSSPDGSGWYCMPEKNDRVRLYFPNEKEAEGYIISSVHESVGDGTGGSASSVPRSNPDNKSLSTKYGKQIELTPSTIKMTNNKGMVIILDDDTGISVISDKDITFESEGKFTMKSMTETMSLEAKESIELKQGNAKMTLKDDIRVEGAQFRMQ